MAAFPDDVLLVIVSNTDIDTFLSLRLLSRKVHDLIITRIHGLTQAVARTTFPNQTRILLQQAERSEHDYRQPIRWLKDLRYQQLAAILLQCPKSAIAAEDPLGDEARSTVAEGWKALDHLARIAREVGQIQSDDVPQLSPSLSESWREGTRDAGYVGRLRAQATCLLRRTMYVETMSMRQLRGLDFLHKALEKSVFCLEDIPPGIPRSGLTEGLEAWVWLFAIMAWIGAEPFWDAW